MWGACFKLNFLFNLFRVQGFSLSCTNLIYVYIHVLLDVYILGASRPKLLTH